MSYQIIILPAARSRLAEIGFYIARTLGEPATAVEYVKKIEKAIQSLSEFPKRIKLEENEELKALNVRKLIVNNYYVYYIANDDSSTVYIVDVIYAHSNRMPKM